MEEAMSAGWAVCVVKCVVCSRHASVQLPFVQRATHAGAVGDAGELCEGSQASLGRASGRRAAGRKAQTVRVRVQVQRVQVQRVQVQRVQCANAVCCCVVEV